ncbi:hypothetical protein L6452_24461 [Arctium lappa]|uniref:Uncharacterized protein n=1 Tax=Arctium lappa TaxID=4217 RepID=A0ACB9AAP5_ARCLA|nr:hypothetical protein L6452_24461 [Arctium lappa]
MERPQKSHRSRQSGPSAKKKSDTDKKKRDLTEEKKQNLKVGKSLLIKSLVKHYTKHNKPDVRGKQRRLQFVECPNDINGMIDAAKFADLALLLIDGSYGFEMVIGVLTHLDKFKDVKKLKKTKQRLKHRFWTEIYDGDKLFYLSGLIHGKYVKREIHNLARFISVMKFHPLSWRTSHPYILVDRLEDVTPPDKVHIAGVGDYNVAGVTGLADPCPLPSAAKKKGLRDKEKLFYAPMSGVGDLLYDKDAVYININDHFVQFSKVGDEDDNSRKGGERDVGEHKNSVEPMEEPENVGSDEDSDDEDVDYLEEARNPHEVSTIKTIGDNPEVKGRHRVGLVGCIFFSVACDIFLFCATDDDEEAEDDNSDEESSSCSDSSGEEEEESDLEGALHIPSLTY